MIEKEILKGVKERLLSPSVLSEVEMQVHREIRAIKRRQKKEVNESAPRGRLKRLDQQISNVAESLAEIGKSETLIKKLKQLEAEKLVLTSRLESLAKQSSLPDIQQNVRDGWSALVDDMENIGRKTAVDPETMSQARDGLSSLLGEITIVETEEGVFYEAGLQASALRVSGLNGGAQERTGSQFLSH